MSKGKIMGNLRRNQMVTGIGPGAIADLKNGSVIISGISKWKYDKENDIINSLKLQKLLGIDYLVIPPHKKDIHTENGGEIKNKDILAYRFPRWGYCPNPKCQKLGELSDFRIENGKWICNTCERKQAIIPSRFIVACEHGHISDFPYREWVHAKKGNLDCRQEMKIYETGETPGLDSIVIQCKCGAVRNLEGIFSEERFDMICNGDRPWLGPEASKDRCNAKMKVLQRSSSAVYYPITVTSIEVPQSNEKIVRAIAKMSDMITDTTKEMCAEIIAKSEEVTVQEVLDEINRDVCWNGSIEDEYRALKQEYEKEEFETRIEESPDFLSKYISKIILVNKMTEIIAQVGFKRIDPNSDINDESTYTSFKKEGIKWLPAIKNKGEGIFIEFNEERIREWEKRKEVKERYAPIIQREDEGFFKSLRKEITPRTILLHTIAHSLIKELTFECGYSSSSIKERIYTTFEQGIDMSGILLYTSSDDSDGSLGGLVAQGKKEKLEQIFRRMIDNQEWCSTDPLCIETALHGYNKANYAACHACELLPETSCELRNILLDRASIRGTLEKTEIGFFEEFYKNEEI